MSKRSRVLMIVAAILIASLLVLTGCVTRELDQSQLLTTTRVCILSWCQVSERTDRVGDPSSGGGDVYEDVNEDNKNDQDGDLSLEAPIVP